MTNQQKYSFLPSLCGKDRHPYACRKSSERRRTNPQAIPHATPWHFTLVTCAPHLLAPKFRKKITTERSRTSGIYDDAHFSIIWTQFLNLVYDRYVVASFLSFFVNKDVRIRWHVYTVEFLPRRFRRLLARGAICSFRPLRNANICWNCCKNVRRLSGNMFILQRINRIASKVFMEKLSRIPFDGLKILTTLARQTGSVANARARTRTFRL